MVVANGVVTLALNDDDDDDDDGDGDASCGVLPREKDECGAPPDRAVDHCNPGNAISTAIGGAGSAPMLGSRPPDIIMVLLVD